MKIGVIFDLDGTLLDTLEDLHDATNYALRAFDCPERSMEDVRQFVGNGVGRLISLSLPGSSDDPSPDAVLPVFREYYGKHCLDKTRPYPGVPEALHCLLKQYPAAVVSNKPDSAVKALCRKFFGDIPAFGEQSGCPRKPAPDMIFHAMKALNIGSCVYVGDSEVDIATAKNAGVPCLSVLWGFRDEKTLCTAGAAYFCRTPAKLPEAIAAMEERGINGK